ncbi:MAG: GlsB/YeaQ/YmgE family stress response membrane protein [Pseudomonadota bacterium]
MSFVIWIVIGGIIGWLASMVMKTDAQQGILLNMVVGIVGALLGGWLLPPLFGSGNIGTINSDDFSALSLLVSFLGAIILLGIVNLLFRGRLR